MKGLILATCVMFGDGGGQSLNPSDTIVELYDQAETWAVNYYRATKPEIGNRCACEVLEEWAIKIGNWQAPKMLAADYGIRCNWRMK